MARPYSRVRIPVDAGRIDASVLSSSVDTHSSHGDEKAVPSSKENAGS